MKLYLERALRKMGAADISAKELSSYVRDLFPEREPAEPSGAPPPVPAADAGMDELDIDELGVQRGSSPLIWIAGAVLLFALIAAAAYFAG